LRFSGKLLMSEGSEIWLQRSYHSFAWLDKNHLPHINHYMSSRTFRRGSNVITRFIRYADAVSPLRSLKAMQAEIFTDCRCSSPQRLH